MATTASHEMEVRGEGSCGGEEGEEGAVPRCCRCCRSRSVSPPTPPRPAALPHRRPGVRPRGVATDEKRCAVRPVAEARRGLALAWRPCRAVGPELRHVGLLPLPLSTPLQALPPLADPPA